MSVLTDTAPKRVWLCVSDDEDDYDLPYPELYAEDAEITWSTDQPVAVTVEYVRADVAKAERDALAALLPGVHYMDPPDGGDVDMVEQFRRMAEDASRWRWWCKNRRDGMLPAQWDEWADRNRARSEKGAP